MKCSILKTQKIESKKWSGGETTELLIYPNTAVYQQLDFDFRLSTATITDPSSTFTNLKDISRTLMVVDGEIELSHNGEDPVLLKKFDQSSFSGDDNTQSRGLGSDFNLMTSGKTKGEIKGLTVLQSKPFYYRLSSKLKFLYIYIIKGTVKVDCDEKNSTLDSNDMLEVSDCRDLNMQFMADIEADIILIEIY
ncbi:HutD family protein [Crocinitomix catalasitica]|uniref:HutD family protein n=1 Tax=Crocinitomix catalasitica TaxID=184607 RepID=UPI000687BDFC|nr:HutD family protein [Crocinitomix catalasitica]